MRYCNVHFTSSLRIDDCFGKTFFFFLLFYVFLHILRQPQCDVCDDNDVRKRHPIEYAIDGTRKWWQSPSLANGLEYEKVNITIDLRQVKMNGQL